GNVDQALDAGLYFDEGAVVGDAHHAADNAAAGGETISQGFPGVRRELADPERNALFFPVELEHFYSDLIAGLDHFRRMIDTAVRHVADVQQAVNTAEVDERA